MTNVEPFAAHASWLWLAGGILLCAAETMVPGALLLWVGLAAIATGVATLLIDLSFPACLILFALLSIAFALVGRAIYGRNGRTIVEPLLDRHPEALVGREFILDQPITQGFGRIRVNDTIWRVRGPDQPSGAKVRVRQVEDGVLLIVDSV